ncbi:hypothetical protein [Fundicoccus culcitae]|uniref:MucBP domain-containing protein n=1 Tax=Fundicoccus culcitae TaxID=2969821 RepID=A0ABY5P6B3_9LACT|nr:hypothetical protein [Fundicoccus culcitae]UUX33943.1 hypothetical protein NRE15_13825 [Fundicoccus culcitae]
MLNITTKIDKNIVISLIIAIFILPYSQLNVHAQTEENEDVETEYIQSNGDAFDAFIPYAQFVKYQYLGNGSNFTVRDIIMEYTSDANGIFQVTEFTGDQAKAFIYQKRESGLYELAYFDEYNDVQDLRYSSDATDGVDSLIIPSNLSVGYSYQSGYHKELTRTIINNFPIVTIGDISYENVYLIEENSNPNGQGITKHFYFAPQYGIIQVDEIHGDGSSSALMQLSHTEGYIGN